MKKLIVLILIIGLLFGGCAYHHEIVMAPDNPLYNRTAIFNNIQYVPILRYCKYYNLDWDWDLVSQRIEITRDNRTLVLRPNSNLALIDNKPIKLEHPVEYRNGAAYLPVKSAVFISEDIFKLEARPLPEKLHYQINTVVIDPGHGGKDSGAARYGTKEKDIVLDISNRLKKELEQNGLNVFMTREKDIFIPLNKRAAFANEIKADIFISVHANASHHSSARGFEVYYLSEATDDNARALAALENTSLNFEEGTISQTRSSSENQTVYDLLLSEHRIESKELGYYICNITSDRMGLEKRGVKGARFAVLKGALMPAVLVEVGFVSNARERSKLNSSSFREKIAKAISSSVLAYKREYERTNGFSR